MAINLPDTGEPFGLPAGTVRGIIALVFTGLFVYDFTTTGTFDVTLLATGSPYLAFYFASRQADAATKSVLAAGIAASSAPVPPPYIPGEPGVETEPDA